MILGIGNDIIEVSRIQSVIKRRGKRFLDRVFTLREQEYCLKHQRSAKHFAARFAAKEALVKALGTGFREGISWLDIEIINNDLGKPELKISSNLSRDSATFHLSMSHSEEYAMAVVIMEARH